MAENKVPKIDRAELRLQAEVRLGAKTGTTPPSHTEHELQRLVHEPEVHQIDLEMQNEELHHAKAEVETVAEKFTALYDFAPVGYFTLDRLGAIRGVNLTGAGLLGIERSRLIGKLFSLLLQMKPAPPLPTSSGRSLRA